MLINIGNFLSLPPEFSWLVEINKEDNIPIFQIGKKKKKELLEGTNQFLFGELNLIQM